MSIALSYPHCCIDITFTYHLEQLTAKHQLNFRRIDHAGVVYQTQSIIIVPSDCLHSYTNHFTDILARYVCTLPKNVTLFYHLVKLTCSHPVEHIHWRLQV